MHPMLQIGPGRSLVTAASGALLAIAGLSAPVTAHCPAANPDLPQCACEISGAAWPSPLDPDEVITAARRSLGAVASCLRHGGQPYWQIQLHINFPDDAHTTAHLDPDISTDYRRQAWCTETIAYWHFQALMPFLGGYGNPDWHPSSHVRNAIQLRTWYRTEEDLREAGFGGRGRWINGGELDYADFQPGVNGPCPGAYQQLEAFNEDTGQWADSCHHSQLVDSLVIWRIGAANGPVTAVDVHVIEGNAGGGRFLDVNGDSVGRGVVKNTTWFRNVIDYTRLGTKNVGCGKRRIRGWGIDLHQDGTTYCDEGRITTIVTPYAIAYPAPIQPEEPDSQTVNFIVNYVMARPGPITVTTNASAVTTGGALPGRNNHWLIPTGPLGVDPVYIQVDFRAEHPLPIRGVVVEWKGGIIPSPFQVLWGGQTGPPLSKTFVPATGATPTPTTQQVPIPIGFGPAANYKVRYLRLAIPASALTRPYEITGLHVLFDYGKEDDGGDVYEAPATTGVNGGPALRDRLRMGANSPNPFRDQTVIEFDLPYARAVEVAIFDIAGRRVRAYGAIAGHPGRNELVWDGLDDSGQRVRSGTYFVQASSGEARGTRRMVFLH